MYYFPLWIIRCVSVMKKETRGERETSSPSSSRFGSQDMNSKQSKLCSVLSHELFYSQFERKRVSPFFSSFLPVSPEWKWRMMDFASPFWEMKSCIPESEHDWVSPSFCEEKSWWKWQKYNVNVEEKRRLDVDPAQWNFQERKCVKNHVDEMRWDVSVIKVIRLSHRRLFPYQNGYRQG